MTRNRFAYAVAGAVVVALGLASRQYATALPEFVGAYAGDTLWAVMVFLGVGLAAPRWSSSHVAGVALTVCYAVEASQLYHAPWVDALRSTSAGGLVLGYGFLWSDLVCYAVGVAVGVLLEIHVLTRTSGEPGV